MGDVVDRASPVPIYRQLEEIFFARISSGEWPSGQRIPSENELNRSFGLSRMTVRGALDTLVSAGQLVRVPGKGTFVAQDKITAVSPAYQGIREQLEVRGYDISTRLISLKREVPPAQVRARLHLGAGGEVFSIVRLRCVDGKPLSVHRSFVPAALAPTLDGLDLVGRQLCVVLQEAFGLDMHSVVEGLEAVAVEQIDAELLGLKVADPALKLNDVISSRAGTVFEYSTIVFRGDRMRLRFDHTHD